MVGAGWAYHPGWANSPTQGEGHVSHHKQREQQVWVHRGTKQPGLLEKTARCSKHAAEAGGVRMDRESGTDHKEL